jgi:hypothetical protein
MILMPSDGSFWGRRAKNTVDTAFFAPDVCDGAQTSCDANEKSPPRIFRWRCLRTCVLRHAAEEKK